MLITGRRGHDCMEVEFTTTCTIVPKATKVVNWNPGHGEVYSIQHYVINLSVTPVKETIACQKREE